MRLSKSFFYTFKEMPSDEESISSKLLVKAGMIRKSSNGIYMIMPLGYRVLKKIENIIREEMNKIDSQELLMPSLVSEEVFEKSGRRANFGSNMFSLKDRYQKSYVLAPTHEELFTMAAALKVQSYKDLGFSLYQIQTKFRDEVRPRFGLIRVREFIMKDAYSFDSDLENLDRSYQKMFKAYKNIFDRIGLDYRIVKADTGAMGGLLSEEFQALSSIGEDVIVICENNDYSANLEITPVELKYNQGMEIALDIEKVHTPNMKTIAEVAEFLKLNPSKLIKNLIYQVDGKAYLVLIPGDRELNETKLLKALNGNEINILADEDFAKFNTVKGFIGPLDINLPIIIDKSLLTMKNFVVGANQQDYHLINVNLKDFKYQLAEDLVLCQECDKCLNCGGSLSFHKSIEVGNTFKLGDKYAKALNLLYADENNKLQPVQMGSYGIGLGRTLAAVVDQYCDDNTINFPKHLAPYQVNIIQVNHKDQIQTQLAEKLYEQLKNKYEVIFDDRKINVGVKFKDSDLIGIPVKIVVGKNAINSVIEFKTKAETKEISTHYLEQFLEDFYV